MSSRRIGLWFIGAWGGVSSTAVLGVSALARGVTDETGLVTALSIFHGVPLDGFDQFVIGGHDIRQGSFLQSVRDLHSRSNVFHEAMIRVCADDLEKWSANVRPGSIQNSGETIAGLADLAAAKKEETPREAIRRIQGDLQQFRSQQQLDQIVVVNAASTEPPFELCPAHIHLAALDEALEKNEIRLPASSLYAYAAIDMGLPMVNFTPSLAAGMPALEELAHRRKAPICGKDGKTGETLMKSVLAPMFAHRNLQILSWVGHNIFGNRDGIVLNDPQNKASKVKSKDALISQIVGYKPQTHVSIEYIESLDDWKTAWDHIHYQGFLGTKMILQFIWQGCDSLLAAPLVLDLARLSLLAQRRGEHGVQKHLACFFKSPMGVDEHDFFVQFGWLAEYARHCRSA